MKSLVICTQDSHTISNQLIQMLKADYWRGWLDYQGMNPQKPDLKQYDFFFVYLISPMPESARLLKIIRQEAPNSLIFTLIDGSYYFVSQEYPYGYDNKPVERRLWTKSEIQNLIGDADVMVAVGEPIINFFRDYSNIKVIEENVFIPVSPLPFSTYEDPSAISFNKLPKPLSFNERCKVVTIQHTTNNWLSTHLEVAKRLKKELIVLGSYDSTDMITKWTENSGVNCEIYPRFTARIAGTTYMELINRGIIGIEDQYIGGSRFSVECAIMKVPVVGTEWAGYLKILAPELITRNGDVDDMVSKAQRLLEDEKYYNEMREKIFKRLWYFSPEKTKERLYNLIRKYRPDWELL